jgi:alanine racemase
MQKEIHNERSWVEIDLSALQHNLSVLSGYMHEHQSFMMIVKADAYGHGAYEISRIALDCGAVYLGVANPEEGRLLRIQGCKAPIMVLSPSLKSELGAILTHDLTTSVSDWGFAQALDIEAGRLGCKAIVHLKADTGMHRSGADFSDFLALYAKLIKLKNLVVEGVFSHFASSESDAEFCRVQEDRFCRLIEQLPIQPKYTHINNSHALLNGYGSKTNLVRLGIAAYGVTSNILSVKDVATDILSVEDVATDILSVENVATDILSVEDVATDILSVENVATDILSVEDVATDILSIEDVETDILSVERITANRSKTDGTSEATKTDGTSEATKTDGTSVVTKTDGTSVATRFQPVMTFKTILSQIKSIRQGESIGYNRSWIAQSNGLYGILPIGYADGYDYLLSNCGSVLLNGTLCPVLGRISMDMICIDLSQVGSPAIGDEAIMLGGESINLRAENLVANYGGNPYELLCQVGRRAKRFYFIKGKLLHSTPLSRREFVPDDFSDSKLNTIIESAIAQRLQSDEIGELIYREILRNYFYDKDKDIHYRHNFHHEITFTDSLIVGYYKATTVLSFTKILQNEYFIVACASSDEVLRRYFKRSDVEYRWLMDNAIDLDAESFVVSSVMVDTLVLNTQIKHKNGCLEIKCSHPQLANLIGKHVRFSINTQTLYPKASHQFSVFISELTRGVDIAFHYPPELEKVECVPVFSGQDKYPSISNNEGVIRLSSKPDEWIFPISGVVFAY